MRRSIVAASVAVLILVLAPAGASAKTPSLKSLAKTVSALQRQVRTLKGDLATARKSIAALSSDLSGAKAAIASQNQSIAALTSDLNAAKTTATELGNTVSTHTRMLTQAVSVLALAPYVNVTTDTVDGVKGPNIFFTGANVHIVDGSGSTTDGWGTPWGLGNLIVGYNEPGTTVSRGGSHNLVCGAFHNYSSWGGLVAGFSNAITGPWATVSGGVHNVVSGNCSTVSGGDTNAVSGMYSAVSGGRNITVSANYWWDAHN